jgi:hypothetical protein
LGMRRKLLTIKIIPYFVSGNGLFKMATATPEVYVKQLYDNQTNVYGTLALVVLAECLNA